MINRKLAIAGSADADPHFSARLFPYRSMSRRAFTIFMALLCLAWLCASTLLWSMGAWPVIGFFGLDVAAIWLAFTLNYRAARAFEEIAVWPHDLVVRQISPGGRISEHRFNPAWARFDVRRHEVQGITSMRLSGEGREVSIGTFLNPDDRESFAAALRRALATVRRR
jgi:uncharacterized membrane protein